MLQKNKKLEIIVPIYNEEKCIDEFIDRIIKLRNKFSMELNVIFINDGSTDKSSELLNYYADKFIFFKVIDFSRNFGHQMAVTAGLDYVDADYVVIIDSDLQDPPELIEEMLKKTEEGFDVVYGRRLTRKGETFFKKITAKFFYAIISKMCDVDIPIDTGDFRLINKKVLDVLKQYIL